MVLLIFDADHQKHLSYLLTVPNDVLREFCRISIEFLKRGINEKVYNSAAQKLRVDGAVVRKGVEGLMHLFMECVKKMLTEIDFLDSTLTLGFNEEQQKELIAFYRENQSDLRQIQRLHSPKLASYRNLQWRLDVNVASRCLHKQISPLFLLKLQLDNGSSDSTLLQTDPVNLIHLTNLLEEALQEMKTQHCRRITRLIK